MAAVVLAFESYRPSPQRPWQNHELAELYRAVDILGRAGLPVVTDMGISDEGDPWFAFCREDNGEVIVHCARIDGFFVASSIAVEGTFRGANFREVIERIVKHEPLRLPLSSASNRLYLHPVMVMAAFVATALLCSKKADAHDLHSAIVSLTPHDAPAVHKGGAFAAVKAALGDLFGSTSVVSSNGSKSQTLPADVEQISLAALMTAALSLLAPVADGDSWFPIAGAADLSALVSAVPVLQKQIGSAFLATSTSHEALLAASDTSHAAKSDIVVTPVSAGAAVELTNAAATIVQADSNTGKAVAAASLPSGGEPSAAVIAPPPEHLVIHRFQDRTISPSVVAEQSHATVPLADPIYQVDFSTVTTLAISILLGGTDVQSQTDVINLIHTHTRSATAVPTLITISITPVDSTFNVGNGQVVTLSPAKVSTDIQLSATPSVVATAPAAAPRIMMDGDPGAGMQALADYAVSSHPVDGTVTVSNLLAFAISAYTAQINQATKIVIFDGDSITLPFFEFAKGVLFVDEHELGLNPTATELAKATVVDLASGGTLRLLGVVDSAHLAGFIPA